MIKKIINKLKRKIYIKGSKEENYTNIDKSTKYKGTNIIKFDKGSVGNEVIVKEGVQLNDVKIRFHGKNSKLYIDKKVKWKGHIIIHGDNRSITIGEGTTCVEVYLMCRDADISIGEYCMFSRGIEIRSSDVHKIYDNQTKERLNEPEDVIIKDRVWVSADATISKGVLISEDSVVGAKSFVNKKFNQNGIVIAGVPAKKIKENIHWER